MMKCFRKTADFTRLTLSSLLLASGLIAGQSAGADTPSDDLLQPYTAQYRITQNGLTADANRTLTRVGQHWRLSQTASKWFITIGEESLMEVTPEQQLRPLQYRYENSFSSKRDQHIEFDWKAGIARDESYRKPYSLPLKADYSDQLTAQLQLRQHLLQDASRSDWQQTIIKNGKLKTYDIEVLGKEQIDTALGKIDTLKLRRKRAGSSAETLIWLAENADYMIVRLLQTEDDDSLTLELVSATVGGKALRSAAR